MAATGPAEKRARRTMKLRDGVTLEAHVMIDDAAVLQISSGPAALQVGVVMTHDELLHVAAMITAALMDLDQDDAS